MSVTTVIRTALRFIAVALVFLGGFWLGSGLGAATPDWSDGNTVVQQVTAFNPFQPVTPRDSPKDRIPENAILVGRERVTIDLANAQWSTFTDTHSMEPVIMKGANAIQIVPKDESEIQVGDIVSYQSAYAEGTIIHRVVYKGQDEDGTYFVMKGDNLPTSDPGRVRFDQIKRVVVAIVY